MFHSSNIKYPSHTRTQVKRLDENDTKTKLETLFKKNLYPTAISLAKSQSYNDGLIDIFTQYGDHLYT